MKSFREFLQDRGQEILGVCNELDCSLREVISQIKEAYANYRDEHQGQKPL